MPEESPLRAPEKLLHALGFAEELASRQQAYEESFCSLLLALLEVMDSFDRFEAAAPSTPPATVEQAAQWRRTIQLIARQLQSALRGAGAEPIACVGQPADPQRHEIVETRSSGDHTEGVILEVMVRGYTFQGRILRSPRVIIARTTKENPP